MSPDAARAKILRVLHPYNGGARKFNVLQAGVGGPELARKVLQALKRDGLARFFHCREGGRWSLTKRGLVAGAAAIAAKETLEHQSRRRLAHHVDRSFRA